LVEAIYSVLIVLTFTLAYRLAEKNAALGPQAAATEVSQLLVAALGCAVAWGIIDGVMYVATSMFQRGQEHRLIVTIVNPALAVRLSNLVAFVMLYAMGYRWGQYVGAIPWKIGLALLLVGFVMVSIALLLGG